MSARGRRAAAAVLASAGLGLGGLVAGAPASAAPGDLTATATMNCQFATFDPFEWNAEVVLTPTQADPSTVSLAATISDMPGVVPIPLVSAMQDATLTIDIDGTEVELTGSGSTSAAAETPIPVPDVAGTYSATSLPTAFSIVTFENEFTAFGMGGVCAPKGQPLPPKPPTTPPAPSPTKTPKAPKGNKGGKGKPAKGSPKMACKLGAPFFSDFDYPSKVTIAGARATAGAKKVSLAGTLSDMPGVAPVVIDALPMRLKVETKIDGKPVTLAGEAPISTSAPNAPIKLPNVSGTVSTDAESLEAEVVGLSFEMDELGGLEITAECTVASGGVLSTMKVGVGKVDKDPGGGDKDPGAGGGSSGGTTGGTVLPKTGGGDSLPVIGLWAGALGLLGAGLLAAVPGSPVRRKVGEHS